MIVLAVTTFGGSAIADSIYEKNHFMFTNQIWSGLMVLAVFFLLQHPEKMFVTSKIKWSKMKYALFPIAFILVLPLIQGGYDFSRVTPSISAYMLSVGFAEELFMHAFAMGVMILAWGDDKKSVVKAAVIGSFLFGLLHLLAIAENPGDSSFVLFKVTTMVFAFLVSMGFAGLVYQANTVWIAVLLHGIIDIVAGRVGDAEFLTNVFENWNMVNSLVTMAFSLPFAIYGYWLLVKDFNGTPVSSI